jgi:hypothetical protein
LIRTLLKDYSKFKQTTYILNDRSREKSNYEQIGWGTVGTISRCGLVVEDVVAATTVQFKILSELLSHSCHHKRISPLIIVSHSLLKQNLNSLLSYFQKIIISGSASNIASLRHLLREFGFTDEEKRFHVQNLIDNKQKFSHFLFDVDQRTITKISFPLEPVEVDDGIGGRRGKKMKSARDALALAKAQRYLAVLPNATEALACWELLWELLPKKLICPMTLEIALATKRGSKPIRVSLISYCAALTSTEPPSKEMIRFHNYCVQEKGIRLPEPFVRNKRLQ